MVPKNINVRQGTTMANSSNVLPFCFCFFMFTSRFMSYLAGRMPPGGASITSEDEAANVRMPALCHTGAIQVCCKVDDITQILPAALLPTPVTAASVVPL